MVKSIDAINERLGRLVSWLTFLLVVLICVDVLLRYVLNFSKAALYEMEWHLFAAIFLLGAAFTLKHDRHVRVDVFYANFTEKNKAWVNLAGTLVFLIPFCGIIAYTSLPFVLDSFAMNESSPDAGGLPYRFVIKLAIPIGMVLLMLQGVAQALRAIKIILHADRTEA